MKYPHRDMIFLIKNQTGPDFKYSPTPRLYTNMKSHR